jgi:hypothetical protein
MTSYVKQRGQLLIDNTVKYSCYPLMESKIFILSWNAEIKKYKLQQVDIGILFRLSIWVHLVIRGCLLHLEPLWTNERHLYSRLNLFFYELSGNKLSNSLYQKYISTLQGISILRIERDDFFMKNLLSHDENEGPHS